MVRSDQLLRLAGRQENSAINSKFRFRSTQPKKTAVETKPAPSRPLDSAICLSHLKFLRLVVVAGVRIRYLLVPQRGLELLEWGQQAHALADLVHHDDPRQVVLVAATVKRACVRKGGGGVRGGGGGYVEEATAVMRELVLRYSGGWRVEDVSHIERFNRQNLVEGQGYFLFSSAF